MTAKVRFAPSPTGYIHVGNIRAALINYLYALQNQGTFLLRIDDTDTARCKPEYEEALYEDLRWLGLHWHDTFHQSHRLVRYREVQDKLMTAGLLYPCYETAEELETKRKVQRAQGKPPVYDRSALKLTSSEKEAFEAQGIRPHWRFLLPEDIVTWPDLMRGPQSMHATMMSDPVLVRADGTFLYTLPSVIDDIDYDITHIFRGEDHISNTAVQIPIFKAVARLSDQTFDIAFGHSSLLLDEEGHPLSKRIGSLNMRAFREQGVDPMAILNYLAYLGTSYPVQPHLRIEDIQFNIANYSATPPKFSAEEIYRGNAKLFHHAPFAWVQTKLTEAQWDLVKYNVNKRSEIILWEDVFYGTLAPCVVDNDYRSVAQATLPPTPWDENTWLQWTNAIKAQTNRKGKELFQPLRQILTGMDHGPEMKHLLPMLDPEMVKQRLA